jgi:hypothetical protein
MGSPANLAEIWPIDSEKRRTAVVALKGDSDGYWPLFVMEQLGFGRGRKEEENETSLKAWGGRRREKQAGETGGYCSTRERDRVCGERNGFPEMETLNPNILFIETFSNSVFSFPLTTTSSYELQLKRTLCVRTRFNVLYNFGKENSFKFLPE